MQKFFFVVYAIAISFQAHAQEDKISGIVNDTFLKSIPDATVSLLKSSDSTWIQSTITNDKGQFTFKQKWNNHYLIDIVALGYEHIIKPIAEPTNNEFILLKKKIELQEVVIKSTAPTISTSLGEMTVNFEKASVTAGDNLIDLLRRTPGVQVDGNGNISMNGKGVLVTINDKQTYLSGEDLNNYLKNISATEVTQVDLMNQPSAKYDAEGDVGIINIKTRKNKNVGLNCTASITYGQGVYANTHDCLNLNYRKNKLSIYLNGGYNHAAGFLNQEENTTTINTYNEQKSFLKETFEDDNLVGSCDYTFNDKLSIGGSLEGIYHPNKEKDITTSSLFDNSTNSLSFNKSENNRGFVRKRFLGNVYGTYKFSKDHSLALGANYLLWEQHEGQQLVSRNYDENMQELPDSLLLNSRFPFSIKLFLANADYEGVLKNGIKIEAGLKSSFLQNNNSALYDVLQNNIWVPDTTRSNNYKYKEQINAAYVSISKKLSEKWNAKLGLRAEQTNIIGTPQLQSQQFTKSFINFFPTAFLSYQLNDNNGFELNAGRRLNRPSYRDLNPFVFYRSQYNYSYGNPNLLPEFRNSIALKHNFKNKIFTELSCARVNNIISPILSYDSVSNAVYNTLVNMASKNNIHFSVTFNKDITKWWSVTSAYNYYYNEYRDTNNTILALSNGQSISLSNQFNYNGWSVYAFYIYNSGDLQSISLRNGPNQWMNATIAKKLWNDTTTISLEINDPFNIFRYTSEQNWAGIHSTGINQYATQSVLLGFTYNFGKKIDNQQHENKIEEDKRM